MAEINKINKTAVRRAITTLKKNGLIDEVVPNYPEEGMVWLTLKCMSEDLIQPKKKVRKPYIRRK